MGITLLARLTKLGWQDDPNWSSIVQDLIQMIQNPAQSLMAL
jgi:hypothetical protein